MTRFGYVIFLSVCQNESGSDFMWLTKEHDRRYTTAQATASLHLFLQYSVFTPLNCPPPRYQRRFHYAIQKLRSNKSISDENSHLHLILPVCHIRINRSSLESRRKKGSGISTGEDQYLVHDAFIGMYRGKEVAESAHIGLRTSAFGSAAAILGLQKEKSPFARVQDHKRFPSPEYQSPSIQVTLRPSMEKRFPIHRQSPTAASPYAAQPASMLGDTSV